jgi:membrane associated rhomboid family serine protease
MQGTMFRAFPRSIKVLVPGGLAATSITYLANPVSPNDNPWKSFEQALSDAFSPREPNPFSVNPHREPQVQKPYQSPPQSFQSSSQSYSSTQTLYIPQGAVNTYRIILLNVIVYGMWQVPQRYFNWHNMMRSYFLISYPSFRSNTLAGKVSLLTATFSHMDLWHLVLNMMGLYSFAPRLMDMKSTTRSPRMSVSEFWLFYCTSGIISSLGSVYFHGAIRNNTPALGASGAIFAVLSYYSCSYPDSQLLLFFFFQTSAATAWWLGNAINLGLMYRSYTASRQGIRGPMIDGSSHLVGTIVGYLWHLKNRSREKSRQKSGYYVKQHHDTTHSIGV